MNRPSDAPGMVIPRLRERANVLDQQILAALANRAPLAEVEGLQKELANLRSAVEKYDSQRIRLWGLLSAIALVIAAAVISQMHMCSAEIALAAHTASIHLQLEPTDEEPILVQGLSPTSLSVQSSRPQAICSSSAAASGCIASSRIYLSEIVAYASSRLRVHQAGPCLNIVVGAGGLRVNFSYWPAIGSNKEEPVPQDASIRLIPGESIRFCGTGNVALSPLAANRIVLGEGIGASDARFRYVPSRTNGTLTINDTGTNTPIGPTDILDIGDLKGGLLAIEMDEKGLAVNAVGTAHKVSFLFGTSEKTLMPTWLDYLMYSPAVKLVLTVVFGIFGAVWAAKGKLREN